MKKPVVIAVTSDLHCRSTVALCPPHQIALDDGGFYSPSKPQKWLWGRWLTYWDRVKEVAGGANLRLVFNGDMVDGNHHGTAQLISGLATVERDVLSQCLEVPLDLKPDAIFIIRGTETHVGKSGSVEEGVGRSLRNNGHPVQREFGTGNASWWGCQMDVHGKRLSFAHHGRMGQRPWTKPNVVMNLAFQIWVEHLTREERPPDIAVRSHLHQFMDTYDVHKVRLIQMPAWQLHTAYTHKIVPESRADIGGIIIIIQPDGEMTVEHHIYIPEPGEIWTTPEK